jgi:hypothetical protein
MLDRVKAIPLMLIVCSGGWINADQLGCYKLLHQAVNHSWVEAQLNFREERGYPAQSRLDRVKAIPLLVIFCSGGWINAD